MSVILSFFEAKERILQTPPRKHIRKHTESFLKKLYVRDTFLL